MGYIVGYSMSLGSLFWLIISEIFPLNIRASGMSISATSQWIANIIVSMTFLSMLQYIGIQNTFYFYAMMCILSLVFCYVFVPETMGVSLEQIERDLKSGSTFNIPDHSRITDL
jgi:MFS family permease